MKIIIREIGDQKIGIIDAPDLVLCTGQDALDLMVEAGYLDTRAILLPAENLCPEFFDLKTRVAGDILQKFSSYQVKLAIFGSFDHYGSESLAALIRESNRGNAIFFVPDIETGLQYLSKKR